MTELLVQIVGANLPSEEMPNGACVILTGDERAVAEAAKLWGKRVVLVRVERVEALTALVREADDLIGGDLVGLEWKLKCWEFRVKARAALGIGKDAP
jgi:hydrogenase maturation factor HypF (carbamoyltransferase family)